VLSSLQKAGSSLKVSGFSKEKCADFQEKAGLKTPNTAMPATDSSFFVQPG
jgi:hypothetical protein